MVQRRRVCGVVAVAALAILGIQAGHAQDDPAVERAKRVLASLREEKFDEVAKEFNAQMTAALPAAQLKDVWATVRGQLGSFGSFIDQQVTMPATGVTVVALGCQFEKAAANVVVAFDAQDKIAGLSIRPRPAPQQEAAAPPPSSRFTEEQVTVRSGQWSLPGTLSMPQGSIAGAVVLVHGSGPNDRDETIGPNKPFRDLAWGLADRGIAVLRYEKRTRQYAAQMALIKNLTVREETIDDAVSAAALLKAHDRLDPKRVFVLGHSLGGTLAPRIAAEDRSLAGLIIMAGATRPFAEVAREQIAYLASLPGATSQSGSQEAALQALLRSAPESYWKDLDTYKPAAAAAQLTIPMLILQGERDYQVSLKDLQGWRDALPGHANATIRSYATLNHLFLSGQGSSTPADYDRAGRIPSFVLDDIAEWMKSQK